MSEWRDPRFREDVSTKEWILRSNGVALDRASGERRGLRKIRTPKIEKKLWPIRFNGVALARLKRQEREERALQRRAEYEKGKL